MAPRARLVLLAPVLAFAAPAAADSLDCTGGIVETGDSRIDLLGKCGPPTLREVLDYERAALQRYGSPGPARRVSTTVERWTYNFGPSRFLEIVTLEAGKVVSIRRGSYGYSLPPPPPAPPIPRASCDASALRTGMSTFDVLALCGEPAFQDVGVEARAGGEVVVEIWTYDFGPLAFVRFLEFLEGKLVKIDTGSYGYAR